VYLIDKTPPATPVITPVNESIFDIVVSPDDQYPIALEVGGVRVIELFEQKGIGEVISSTVGNNVTLTSIVFDESELAQPSVPDTVYIIVAVPLSTPDSIVPELKSVTRAIVDRALEDHTPPSIVEVNVVVLLAQIFVMPPNIPA